MTAATLKTTQKIARIRKKKALPTDNPFTHTPLPNRVLAPSPAATPATPLPATPRSIFSTPIPASPLPLPGALRLASSSGYFTSIRTASAVPRFLPRLRKPRRKYVTLETKLHAVLDLLKSYKLTIGSFLYHISKRQDNQGRRVRHSSQITAAVARFLTGTSGVTVAEIVDLWFNHPFGQPRASHSEQDLMFKQDPVFTDVRHARPALSCFAAQICADRVERDAIRAVQPGAGLHVHVRVPRDVTAVHSKAVKKQLVTRQDLRSNVVAKAQHVIERDCSLIFDLNMRAAHRTPGKVKAVRVQRPPEIVVTGAISNLLFARKRSANLLPLSNALALFAARGEQSLFRIGSRFGTSTAYSTAYRSLITLADGQRDHVRALASSTVKVVGIVLDNAQHFSPQWDSRVGRADTMYKGVVGTAVEYEDCAASALDAQAMESFTKARKAGPGLLNWRAIVSDIDHAFLQRTGELNWLDVVISRSATLTRAYRSDMQQLFKTDGLKHQVPVSRHTVTHPLRSNAHDPSLATGLKDAVMDFYSKQLGLAKEGWQPRLMFVGGDGGTFEGLLRLQKYLQTAPSAYDRLDWMYSKLELFHTKWTAASRIAHNHWGSDRSIDPSCLGHSAKAINRKTPSNLKKIDFSRDCETLFIIGEARMLDCWSILLEVDDLEKHFEHLHSQNKLPSLNELRVHARKLYRTYSCQRAYLQALKPHDKQSANYRAPLAQKSPSASTSTASTSSGEAAGVVGHVEDAAFAGDRALANSIKFLDDFVELREWFRSTSVGEIGSTWEIVKNQIPKFAGSGHNPNYVNYCLMMYHIVEKYSTPALREAHLNNWLVNQVGRPGHFKEGDLMQEHFINRLDRHLQHKDRQYDEPFIRDVISPNLDILSEIPRQMEESVSLHARSRRHFNPATRTEVTILMNIYRDAELHRFSRGRSLGFAAKDHHTIGTLSLLDPNDMPRKFREFHSNLNVLHSASTRSSDASQWPPSADIPDDGHAGPGIGSGGDKEAAMLHDTALNDQSDEIAPAEFGQRCAIFFNDGQLTVEEDANNTESIVPEDDAVSSDEEVQMSDLDVDPDELEEFMASIEART